MRIVEVELRPGYVLIGRHPECDVVVDDDRVSGRHLLLEALPGNTWRVQDLGSRNGTYLERERVSHLDIDGPRRLHLGHPDRGLVVDLKHPAADAGAGPTVHVPPSPGVPAGVVLEAVVVRRGSAVLLDQVSVTFPHGRLTAVVGPSGAGKSTLLAAATGATALDGGRVLVAGADLAALDAARRSALIGVVPQDDVLHTSLSLKASLRCSARLLLPARTSRRERRAEVDRVIAQLHLGERAGVRIDRLSGGQRKRANAATAMLTRPEVLVLDEPTSGLDPHLERVYMDDLADLAERGCTVVVVTHSPAAVERADHVVVVAAGRVAYEGPPADLPEHFRARGLGTVFERVGEAGGPAWADAWAEAWPARSPSAGTRRMAVTPPAVAAESRRHHLAPLLGRNLRLLAADRGSLALLLLQAPVLGLLTRLFPDGGGFDAATAPNGDVRTVLLVLVLAATWLGTLAAIRQVVDERVILLREFRAGVSPLAYLVSRAVLLAGLVVVQVLGLVVGAFAGRDLPSGRLVERPGVELVLVLVVTGWAASAVGLLVSSLARSGAGAAALAPLVVVPQLLLCGALLRVDDPTALDVLSRLVSARAGFSAVAASTDLVGLEQLPDPPAAWGATAGSVIADAGELALLTLLALTATHVVLRRRATATG